MKSSSWRFRRRSTGHLPQLEQFHQQLGVVPELGKSIDAGPMQPIDEHPCISSPQTLRKNRSFSQPDNKDFTDAVNNVKMANNSGKSKKKSSFTSYMQIPVIGTTRSSSPIQGGSTAVANGNDHDPLSAKSSTSSTSTIVPKTPLLKDQSFSFSGSADWTLQREMTFEEELEIQLHKVTGAAQEWKNRYISEQKQCANLNKSMLEREREYKSVLKSLTNQYDSQITEVRNKLFVALDTADALAEDNRRMNADLKDLQQQSAIRTGALESRVANALKEVQALKDNATEMQKQIEQLQEDKKQLTVTNEKLKDQLQKEESSREKIKQKVVQNRDSYSDYYRILLDLALDKIKRTDQCQKKAKLRATKSAGSVLGHNENQPKLNAEARFEAVAQCQEAQGHRSPPMDTRSMDSMTSLESLLSDMTDSLSSSQRTQHLLDMTDCNDNVTVVTARKVLRELHGGGSPQIPRHRHGQRHSLQPTIDHQRQASEPLSGTDITRSLGSLADSRNNQMQLSFSDTNLYDLMGGSGLGRPDDFQRNYEEGKLSGMSTPMPTLVETPAEMSSLERKRSTFMKSYSDDVHESVPDPRASSDLPLTRVLSDGAAEQAKRKSPAQSPQVKMKSSAKKAARQLNIIKRWQAGEIDFPWKRRNSGDKASRDDTTSSLPRRHELGDDLKTKLEHVAKTSRSQEDLLSCDYDDIPHIVINRSGSITSTSSVGSVDFDLEGQGQEVKVTTSTKSGFEQLRSRRNGITDGPEMRKSPSKGEGKNSARPKSVDTELDEHAVAADQASTGKHKFFKKKYWSVKK